MSNPLDTEALAKQDIIARPEVTGEKSEDKKAEKKPKDSAKKDAKKAPDSAKQEVLEPDPIEVASSKVISKSLNELRTHIGAESDPDFSALLSEVLSGGFVAIRFISGKPWIRFLVASGALGIGLVPPVLKFMAKKKEQKEQENADK